ncbi:glycosyltransferase family 2 protein [Flavobacterium xueshanense]|uniref:Glycosyltransferase involved in cell wall bisynthesis n=1 Tax=Flavobacterium xueshanense TaxID=935223 RepID=A0A1I2GDR3_9FLAO|nr:glycosyltransferase family A protein [Flavobacterium xueshanense]SFF15642.1 Glycosyltransferase involved in cell wall bisynthesis [Flavobacterium xueshanense]
MMSIQVSIIVPCYKQAHFLNESLLSVLAQTYTNWECIIVNDGSPDDTERIAEQWSARDNRFKYLKKENGGLSSARNAGIASSKGEYILPLDADDILHEDYLTFLVPELQQNSSLAIVSCYSNFFINNRSNIIHQQKPIGTTYHALLYENNMMASSLYHKKYWEEVGGYDENMKDGFEDWEFWIAITKKGREYKFVEAFLFYYRKSKKSMFIDTLAHHLESNMEYVFKKHNEIYIAQFGTTMEYLFSLIKRHHASEHKIKKSVEYKIAKIIAKPFRIFQKLMIKK